MNSVFKKGCRLEDAMHEEFEVFLFILWLNRNEKYYETAFIFHQSQTSLLNIFLAEEGLWMRVSWIFPLLVWLITPSYAPTLPIYSVYIFEINHRVEMQMPLPHSRTHKENINVSRELTWSIFDPTKQWGLADATKGWWKLVVLLCLPRGGLFSQQQSNIHIYMIFR